MKLQQIILLPFSLLYGFGLFCHRSLYHIGLLKTHQFKTPIINIGNLSVGGTGKSPHVEMVHRLLDVDSNLAIISRGYGRKSKGFRYVELTSKASAVGDEPKQFKVKFPNSIVAVSEQRSTAVEMILKDFSKIDTFILDDAFQHWAIQASVNILLSTFDQPFFKDYLLPSGRLREFRSGYRRANILIISKCPSDINQEQKQAFLNKIQVLPHQKVFFSYFDYRLPYALLDQQQQLTTQLLKQTDLLIVTAIADTSYLEKYLYQNSQSTLFLRFSDHHFYTPKDLALIQEKSNNKTILVTQKDAEKLLEHRLLIETLDLNIYVLAIEVKFAFDEEGLFKKTLLEQL